MATIRTMPTAADGGDAQMEVLRKRIQTDALFEVCLAKCSSAAADAAVR